MKTKKVIKMRILVMGMQKTKRDLKAVERQLDRIYAKAKKVGLTKKEVKELIQVQNKRIDAAPAE